MHLSRWVVGGVQPPTSKTFIYCDCHANPYRKREDCVSSSEIVVHTMCTICS